MRIVEAAMELHEEIGPRATTISAIAERADVQRLTVYRHFDDETALFQACTSHWLSLNRPPDPENWTDVEDGTERIRKALAAFYGYYRRTARMWSASHRDESLVPALQEPMDGFRAFVGSVGDDLSARLDSGGEGRAGTTVTIHHALAFPTWRSLDRQGLTDEAMVDLAMTWIDGASKM